MLPFLGWASHCGKTYRAYVDCHYVLGASLKGLPEHGAWGGDARAHLALCKHASIDDWRPLYWGKLCRTTTHMAPNGESLELRKNKTSNSIFSRWFHDFEGCPSHCDSL
ncbi:hypothetical protein [Ralstonia pseudosolanacearum]